MPRCRFCKELVGSPTFTISQPSWMARPPDQISIDDIILHELRPDPPGVITICRPCYKNLRATILSWIRGTQKGLIATVLTMDGHKEFYIKDIERS